MNATVFDWIFKVLTQLLWGGPVLHKQDINLEFRIASPVSKATLPVLAADGKHGGRQNPLKE